MKLLLFATDLLCLIGVAVGSDDEQLVRQIAKSFVTDYNNGDFKNAPSDTTDEKVHLNPVSGLTRGQEEVLKKVRAISKTTLKRVSVTIESMTVQFGTDGVALVDAIHRGDSYITHENERQMKTYLVVKQKGKWLLALDQNSIVSNP